MEFITINSQGISTQEIIRSLEALIELFKKTEEMNKVSE